MPWRARSTPNWLAPVALRRVLTALPRDLKRTITAGSQQSDPGRWHREGLRHRPGSPTAPPPIRPNQPPPPEPGRIPLTIPEIKRLLAALAARLLPRWLIIHWDAWTRRHQARSRWFHKRTRLVRDAELPWSASEMRLPYWQL